MKRLKTLCIAATTGLAVGVVMMTTGAFGDTTTVPSCGTTTTVAPPPSGTLQIDASSPPVVLANGNNVTQFEATTASFSPPAHALLVAMASMNNYAPDQYYNTTLSYVDSDGTAVPLVWTRQVGSNWPSSGTEGGAEIWTATTGDVAPGAITVSAESDYTNTSSADWVTLDVQVVTETSGATPTVGATAAGAQTGGLPSVALPTSALGFAAVSDWDSNGGAAAYGPGLTQVASGQSPATNGNPPDYAYHFFRGNASTFNMTAPSPQTWNEAVVEVQP